MRTNLALLIGMAQLVANYCTIDAHVFLSTHRHHISIMRSCPQALIAVQPLGAERNPVSLNWAWDLGSRPPAKGFATRTHPIKVGKAFEFKAPEGHRLRGHTRLLQKSVPIASSSFHRVMWHASRAARGICKLYRGPPSTLSNLAHGLLLRKEFAAYRSALAEDLA